MIRSIALTIAIDALQRKSEYILFASDGKVADDKRIEIAEAILVLGRLKLKKGIDDDDNSDV